MGMTCVQHYFSDIEKGNCNGPKSVQLEISGKCMSRCDTCNVHTTQYDGELKFHPTTKQVMKGINNLAKNGCKSIRLTGGEPIQADDFEKIVEKVLSLGMTPSITTTLQTKKKSRVEAVAKCRRIKISLPCVGDEYEKFFKIDSKMFKIVDKNLHYLRELKTRFAINYTIFDGNYSEKSIMAFIEYINQFSPTYVTFFPALDYEHDDAETIVANFAKCAPFLKCKSNIKTIEKHFKRRKPKKEIICHINKFTAHIKSNGDMYPCCMTGGEIGQTLDDKFLMGNIYKSNIEKIYKKSFDMFKDVNLAEDPICSQCTQRYLMVNDDYKAFLKADNFKEV